MNIEKVNKKLKSICSAAGLMALIYDEGEPDFYHWDQVTGYAALIPSGEVDSWTRFECGLMSEGEYREERDRAARQRQEDIRRKTEDQDYHNMWLLYQKYGGQMPTKFPSEVLTIARACVWDSPEYVDVTLNGVTFHVTKGDIQ